MWKEFRDFINRGNVVDLAVAVAMGAAFTAIVNSLTADILMPLVGVLLGGIDFAALAFSIGDATITYGNFIQAIINFIIVAFVLFLVVKGYNAMQEQFIHDVKEEKAATPPPADVQLLTEIRDLLKEQTK
jgi:large conductance mechanosensitive channel